MALNSFTPLSINSHHVSCYPSSSKVSKSSQVICKMSLNNDHPQG